MRSASDVSIARHERYCAMSSCGEKNTSGKNSNASAVAASPKAKRGRQRGERREQQRERGAVLVVVEVLLGVGGVQVTVREQVRRGGAEHTELVRMTHDALLHRNEHGACEVQAQEPVAHAIGHGGGTSPRMMTQRKLAPRGFILQRRGHAAPCTVDTKHVPEPSGPNLDDVASRPHPR